MPVEVKSRIYAICPLSLQGEIADNFQIFSQPKSSRVSVQLPFRDRKCDLRGLGERFVKVFPLAFTHFGASQKALGGPCDYATKLWWKKLFERQGKNLYETQS